jgi:hypothetical protein
MPLPALYQATARSSAGSLGNPGRSDISLGQRVFHSKFGYGPMHNETVVKLDRHDTRLVTPDSIRGPPSLKKQMDAGSSPA